jgi:ribonuclease BN (tRNA processing enzyme)
VAVPNQRRAPAAHLIEGARDSLLLDAGACVMLRLEEAGADYTAVDGILISHFHPDHVAGLVPFLFAHHVPGNPRRRSVDLVGAPGLAGLLTNLRRAWGDWLTPRGFDVNVREVREHAFSLGEFQVQAALTTHSESSLAFRVQAEDGKVAVYSGDTPYARSVVKLARGADLLVLECSYPRGFLAPGHLTADQAGRMAAEAGVPRLLLTHFYPPCGQADIRSQAAQHFDGDILLAEDCMAVDV